QPPCLSPPSPLRGGGWGEGLETPPEVSVNIRLDCPSCDTSDRVQLPGAAEWHCPSCEHIVKLHEAGAGLSHCAACGNAGLYRKKDFPHGLGMTILVLACVASTITYW